MAQYRDALPQLSGALFLTDGGLETSLIFDDGLEMPDFAAFHLLKDEGGRQAIERYYRRFAEIARDNGTGFILESATWRASPDWGKRLGYSGSELAEANHQAIEMLRALRRDYETDRTEIVVSGCVGPRGDGYDPGELMTEAEAENYHAFQACAFRDAGADMITAITMTNVAEAVGVTRAAAAAGMPVAISFTVETDGKLPTGQPLKDAIEAVDEATGNAPVYYMVNCAHPTHFQDQLSAGEPWLDRIRGLRANASTKSHAELDEATELDEGDPAELAGQYRDLRAKLTRLNVLGGCCGTDHRHVAAICEANLGGLSVRAA